MKKGMKLSTLILFAVMGFASSVMANCRDDHGKSLPTGTKITGMSHGSGVTKRCMSNGSWRQIGKLAKRKPDASQFKGRRPASAAASLTLPRQAPPSRSLSNVPEQNRLMLNRVTR
jgi:hypothetical protein